jgi:choline dehydrogenase-like flavoprotein
LASAGVDVLVLEEGPDVPAGSLTPFSLEQMRGQYRNLGELMALGVPPVSYAEGCCLGGSTEINSGLYHRPHAELLARWSRGWTIEDLDAQSLAGICLAIERNLNVTTFPEGPPPASRLLQQAARRIGWEAQEIPRWFRFDSPTSGVRQTMTLTYLEHARKHGARLRSGAWVERLIIDRGRAKEAVVVEADGRRVRVGFDSVFVCGGAVQSAALLLRSGIRRNVGGTLSMHPTVKAVAHTPEPVNDPTDVPVVQVREFSPHMSMGGSATNLSLLGLALLRTHQDLTGLQDRLRHMPIYYAAIRTQGRGHVRVLPRTRDPLVTYRMTNADIARLRLAMGRLLYVLLQMEGTRAIPSVLDGDPITSTDQIPEQVAKVRRRTAEVMTVHICSSTPMGEDRSRCAVDSYGRSHDVPNVIVNDASILNEAPGINPQGTVMALATRNAERFLDDHGQTPAPREYA